MWVNGRTLICLIVRRDQEELVQFYGTDEDFFFPGLPVKSAFVPTDIDIAAATDPDSVPGCDLDPNLGHGLGLGLDPFPVPDPDPDPVPDPDPDPDLGPDPKPDPLSVPVPDPDPDLVPDSDFDQV